jgi:hypothetical protein
MGSTLESDAALTVAKEFSILLERPPLAGTETGSEMYSISYEVSKKTMATLVREYEDKTKPNDSQPMADKVFEGLAVRHYLITKAIFDKYVAGPAPEPIPATAACPPSEDRFVPIPGFKPITIYLPPNAKAPNTTNPGAKREANR